MENIIDQHQIDLNLEKETMGMNEKMGLPNGPMEVVTIAFDVDGTLIRDGGNKADIANERIVELLKILSSFKNVKIIVWSGGGQEYAERWGRLIGVDDYVWKYMSKINANLMGFKPTIAIDDIQDTKLGQVNLIVREK